MSVSTSTSVSRIPRSTSAPEARPGTTVHGPGERPPRCAPRSATVCISGTLEDKLAAAAARRLRRRGDLRAGLRRVAAVGRRGAVAVRRPGAVDRSVPAVPGLRLGPTRRRCDANLRRADRKFDVMEQLGTDLVLVCSAIYPDAVDDDDADRRAAAPAGRPGPASAGMRISLRGAGLVDLRQHLRAVLGHRADGRPPRPRAVHRQLPHPVPGLGSGRNREHPGREVVLPAARRRPVDGHGRAAVEPALPAVPRPGRLRPAGLPRPCADRRVHRAAVARGLQRRVPAVRPDTGRGRRAPLAAGPARGHRRPAAGRRPATALPTAAAPPVPTLGGFAFAELAVDDDSSPAVEGALAALGLHPRRAAPDQAGAAVGAGRRAGAAELRPSASTSTRTGAAVAALGLETAEPAGRRGPRPGAAGAGAAPPPRTGRGRPLRRRRAGRDVGVLLPHRVPTTTSSWLVGLPGRPDGAMAPPATVGIGHHATSTTSRSTQPFDRFDEAALFYRTVLGPADPAQLGDRGARSAWCATGPSPTRTARCGSA